MYQYTDSSNTAVRKLSTGATIPIDSGNRHYRAFLAWLDDGNTPLPAPEEPEPAPSSDAERIAALEQAVVDLALGGML